MAASRAKAACQRSQNMHKKASGVPRISPLTSSMNASCTCQVGVRLSANRPDSASGTSDVGDACS